MRNERRVIDWIELVTGIEETKRGEINFSRFPVKLRLRKFHCAVVAEILSLCTSFLVHANFNFYGAPFKELGRFTQSSNDNPNESECSTAIAEASHSLKVGR